MSSLERIAWTLTVLIGLIGALLFILASFRGYALLALLLAIAASVNLAPPAGHEREPDAGR